MHPSKREKHWLRCLGVLCRRLPTVANVEGIGCDVWEACVGPQPLLEEDATPRPVAGEDAQRPHDVRGECSLKGVKGVRGEGVRVEGVKG